MLRRYSTAPTQLWQLYGEGQAPLRSESASSKVSTAGARGSQEGRPLSARAALLADQASWRQAMQARHVESPKAKGTSPTPNHEAATTGSKAGARPQSAMPLRSTRVSSRPSSAAPGSLIHMATEGLFKRRGA